MGTGAVNREPAVGRSELASYVMRFAAGGYPVAHVVEAVCGRCQGGAFRVEVDDEEGCARRWCTSCGVAASIADSAGYWDDAEPGYCECPCGGDTFGVGVGFAMRDDGEVRWVSVGLRCLGDGALGVYTDWKIDYSPSRQLLDQV